MSDRAMTIDADSRGTTRGTRGRGWLAMIALAVAAGSMACGGGDSDAECVDGAECESGVCAGGECAVASCQDGVANGDETGVDCGGACARCEGDACVGASECASGFCDGSGVCGPAECTSAPCLNGGACASDGAGGVACACAAGWTGERCEQADPCAAEPCGDGTCADDGSGFFYTCACPDGQFDDGETCALCAEVEGCDEVVCSRADDATCAACAEGYEPAAGGTCVAVSVCADAPCGAGTCVAGEAGEYTCTCPAGQRDDGTTCVACGGVDDCVAVTCTTEEDSRCTECASGYAVDDDGLCEAIDGCADAPCGDGTCEGTGPGVYSCVCPDGQYDDGSTCVACAGIAGCESGLSCTSPDDSVCADCAVGRYGAQCAECASVANCEGAVTCTDAEDSACVQCAAGFFGAQCAPCGTIAQCEGVVTCTDATDSVCSQCEAGTFGDTCQACTDIDGCVGDITCTDATDSVCSQCVVGRFGDTCQACTAIGGCVGDITCTDATDSVCSQCEAGTFGDTCQACTAVGGCVGDITCTDATDSVCSQCVVGTFGDTCQACTAIDGCVGDITCTDATDSVCSQCEGGTFGNTCQACTAIDGCVGDITCTDATDSVCSQCEAGTFGDTCQACTAIDGCVGDITCTDATDSVCSQCEAGTFGDTCQACTDIDGCVGDITCTDATDSVCSQCVVGRFGDSCQICTPVDDCVGTVTCTDATNSVCSDCPAGTWGDGCVPCSEVANCTGDVVCSNADDSACDACADGYYGGNCAPCDEITGCVGQVTCSSGTDSVCSQCDAGYFGPDCAACTPVDNCEDATVTCDGDTGDATCDSCEPGYFGPDCAACIPVDNCDDATVTCDGDTGDATCDSCEPGYFGPDCAACIPVDNCEDATVTCDGDTGDATCDSCEPGYFGSDCAACTPVDNCEDATVTCDATTGDATCDSCEPGYFGPDCAACTPVDNCEDATVICDGDTGDATCDSCEPGYFGSDCAACTPVDNCEDATVTCDGDTGDATCDTCEPGYFGPDCAACTPVDNCEDATVTCDATTGDATCDSCEPGYFGSDCAACTPVDNCEDATVTCDGDTGDATCDSCEPGYFGSDCAACTPVDNCDDATVTCDGDTGDATCDTCDSGYFGPDCAACTPVDNCDDATVTCDGDTGDATCDTCEPGYFGPNCSTCPTIDDCEQVTCGSADDATCASCASGYVSDGAGGCGLPSACDGPSGSYAAKLVITAIFDGPLPNGLPKGIELYALEDIEDLSAYDVRNANNGAASFSSTPLVLPAMPLEAGSFVWVASTTTDFEAYFGFAPTATGGALNVNGDDVIGLFHEGQVIDTFGVLGVDGTGEIWDYMDGWAHRVTGTGPRGVDFQADDWIFSGANALDGCTDNASCASSIPIGTFSAGANPCGAGTCSDVDGGGYSCACPDATYFDGATCTACTPVDNCDDATVTCDGDTGDATCVTCTAGYFGPDCAACTPVDNCDDATVTCDATTGDATCVTCDSGYFGPDCAACTPVDNCDDATVTCDGDTGDATCTTCTAGYFGPDCAACTPVDNCDDATVTCDATTGDATCVTCDSGYFGPDCAACTPVDNCDDATVTCDATTGDATCNTCDSGYFGPDCAACTPVDNCDDATVTCDGDTGDASCTTCTAGYFGPDCAACTPIDNCDDATVTCDGDTGDATCTTCTAGYFGPDCAACTPVDNCDDATVTCDGDTGDATCTTCTAGYFGPDCAACTPVDNCDDATVTCDGDTGDASCTTCAAGYFGPDCAACTPVDNCDDATVTCDGDTGVSACSTCEPGYYGPTCAICPPIDDCEQVTCGSADDATCVACASGYVPDGAGGCELPSACGGGGAGYDLILSGVVHYAGAAAFSAVELYAGADVPDLGAYALGYERDVGGGHFFLPTGIGVAAGDRIVFTTDQANYAAYFGVEADGVVPDLAVFDGTTMVGLFDVDLAPLDSYGEPVPAGEVTSWTYSDSWAYRAAGATPTGATFVADSWSIAGIDALAGCASAAECDVPFGTFGAGSGAANPCGPGVCSDVDGGGYSCACPDATYFDGTTCAACTAVANCADATVTCDAAGDATCLTCESGYFGPDCAACTPVANCADTAVTCDGDTGVGTCTTCDAGYYGPTCATCPTIDDCDQVTCGSADDASCVACASGYVSDGAGGCELPSACGGPTGSYPAKMVITAVFDGPLTGGLPKGIELYALEDIEDLGAYDVRSATNGAPGFGGPLVLPSGPLDAGTFIWVASEDAQFNAYFGFAPTATGSAVNINGDDVVGLFHEGQAIDTFGVLGVDGSGQFWDYLDGWAYRVTGTGPRGVDFQADDWVFSGINALDDCGDNTSCPSSIPVGTFSASTNPCGPGVCSDVDGGGYSCACPDATYFDGTTCAACAAVANCADATVTCDAAGASTCVTCDAGYFGPDCAACTAVPNCTDATVTCDGDTGLSTCMTCDAGYFGSDCAACTAVPNCTDATVTCDGDTGVSACTTCEPGYYGATCAPCPPIANCAAVSCTAEGVSTCETCEADYVPDGAGGCVLPNACGDPETGYALILSGVVHLGGDGAFSAVELYAGADIPDLAAYALGYVRDDSNNFDVLPEGVSLTAGDRVVFTSDEANYAAYFGVEADGVLQSLAEADGTTAIVLFDGALEAVDTYGVPVVAGEVTSWSYIDSWAYRLPSAVPGATFAPESWTLAGVNDLLDCTSDDACDVPFGTFSPGNPCGAGTCADDGGGGYTCDCPDSTYFDGTTCAACTAVPNCADATVTCDAITGDATCVTCDAGHYDADCTACTAVDNCNDATVTCDGDTGISTCLACNSGYQPNGDATACDPEALPPTPRFAFPIEREDSGKELVVTDCTLAGTHFIDINPATPGFDYQGCLDDGNHPFDCDDLQDDCETWPYNTYCGGGGSGPQGLTAFGDAIYFTADDGTHGRELWRYTTDGGAELVENLRNAELPAFEDWSASLPIPRMVVFNDQLYFQARDNDHGIELYSYAGDGTPIALVADLNPTGEAGAVPSWLTVSGDRLYMELDNPPGGGDALWYVDTNGDVAEIPLPDANHAVFKLTSLGEGGGLAFQYGLQDEAASMFLIPPGEPDSLLQVAVSPNPAWLPKPLFAAGLSKVFYVGLDPDGNGGLAWMDVAGQSAFVGPVGANIYTGRPLAYDADGAHVYYVALTPGGVTYGTDGETEPTPVEAMAGAFAPVAFKGKLYYLSTDGQPRTLRVYDPADGSDALLFDWQPLGAEGTAILPLPGNNMLAVALLDGLACVDLTDPSTPQVTHIRGDDFGASWSGGALNTPENQLFTSF